MARVLLAVADQGALFSGRVRRYNRAFPPLDLLGAAAILRDAGHEVCLADCRARPDHRLRLLEPWDLILVSTSPLDRWQCPNTDLDQLDRFLDGVSRRHLVLSGVQGTVRPALLLERTGAAGLVLGPPEALVTALAEGVRPGEAPGTARLEAGSLVRGPEPEPVEPGALPMPAFELVDYADYRYEVLGERLGLLEATRGCPWRCRFCLLEMYGRRYRKKSAERVALEARALWDAGARCVYFQDLEMTADRDLTLDICDALRDRVPDLRWACQTRADTVDRELLEAMRAAGCELIHFGVESGDDRVLATTNKGQSLDAVERALSDARDVGLRTVCFFLIGLPGETRAQMQATLRFALRVRPTWASFQVATPYPGTAFHSDGDWSTPFPEAFPGPLEPDALRRLARHFTLRYHLAPRYLLARLRGPGRRHALREVALLARYALS